MKTLLPQTCYDLRSYQYSLVQQIFAYWHREVLRVLLQLPTGGGKTVVFSRIALEFVLKGEKVLVLVHREELLLQAKEKLESVTEMPVGVIKAGYQNNPNCLIQVASVQTLIRRKCLPEASLIVIDEAHHSCSRSYTQILEAYPTAYILGVTATPARIDGRGFKFLFDSLVPGPSVQELIDTGHLSGFKLFAATHPIETKGVKTTAGEFNQKDLAERVNTSQVRGDLIKTYRDHANGKKTVVFCVSVEHSKTSALAYNEAGIPAEHLDGETPADERRTILTRFAAGEILVLCNCGIVSEGFDIPSIEAVQIVRPTKSLPLWLQMVGRALRPHPRKEYAVIIDHTQNWFFHGLPDEDREWSLDPVSLKVKKWALQCPECNHIFKPLPHEQKQLIANCPNCQVNFEFEVGKGGDPPPARLITQDQQVQLEEVLLEADPEILSELHHFKKLQEAKGYKSSWVYFKLVESRPNLGLAELRECARLLGYKPGWAWHKFQERQGLKEEVAA